MTYASVIGYTRGMRSSRESYTNVSVYEKSKELIGFCINELKSTGMSWSRPSCTITWTHHLITSGLLQYGKQVMKEKDQVFIYVNRRASLIDSTISSPGYHQISTDKEYVRKEYYFNCLQDILHYWLVPLSVPRWLVLPSCCGDIVSSEEVAWCGLEELWTELCVEIEVV